MYLLVFIKHRKKRFFLLLFLLFSGIIFLYYKYDPSYNLLAPKCFFRQLTGLDCPGCGSQRAFHALLHGNLRQAIRYNYFFLYAIPYLFAMFLCRLFKTYDFFRRGTMILEGRIAITLYLLLYFFWLIFRNIYHL